VLKFRLEHFGLLYYNKVFKAAMKQQFNLDREFIKWFYEEAYPEQGSNRSHAQAMGMTTVNINVRDYWMREAYKQGALAMANETRCILQEYAAACSGLNPELICPDEVFDRAEYNLKYYFDKVFAQ
jgi:hypothetical protein